MNWIDEAVHAGARLLCGGRRRKQTIEPTVLTGTRPEMKVNCQEVFGPVVTVEPYSNFDQALRLVNNSSYGIQAGVFTRDAKLLFQAYEELEVGALSPAMFHLSALTTCLMAASKIQVRDAKVYVTRSTR